MNKVILIGNLTKDPEAGKTQNDISYARFSIAVNRRSNREVTDYFNCIAWRGLADTVAKNLVKGKKVGIVGELQTREYQDRYGQNRTAIEILCDDIDFLSPKDNYAENGSHDVKAQTSERRLEKVDVPDDNLPF